MCVFTFFTCQENPDAVFSLASGDSFFTCQEPAANRNVLHLQTASDVCFYILHLPREPRCCFFLSFFRTTPDVYKHIQMNGGLTTNTKILFHFELEHSLLRFPHLHDSMVQEHPVLQTTTVRCRVFKQFNNSIPILSCSTSFLFAQFRFAWSCRLRERLL